MITSKDNEKIKRFCKLQTSRKERAKHRLFAIEGVRLAQEALRCGVSVCEVFCTDWAAKKYPDICESLQEHAHFFSLIAPELEKKLTDLVAPQGIYCVCEMPAAKQKTFEPTGQVLILDQLQDPGNLGSILRSADAFGVRDVLVQKQTADVYSPKVLRSAMGSVFRVRVFESDDLVRNILELKEKAYQVFGAALDETAKKLGDVSFHLKSAVVIGNEGGGISPAVLQNTTKLYIPMKGETESLNAAAAAAILLWEMGKGGA